ncbi:hypothetical protein EJ05DRAFT_479053 [Pseudovirgaria hyperparasitica]|uniref:CENP-V/GFA domain-containing protein n=1 Tax=Pseudovirgaria hyperparasitica TaxID=470096 RepID=A0A6A6VZF2_9PEZI|nr:uncharacterized protein EJ05DRAFT_479053 [Pseudovirgaria hyperparasitica]KAF2755259.1 hypothetical protein EJ05DRAFT_479053 [Pseudovirgaria hyperparasitica]
MSTIPLTINCLCALHTFSTLISPSSLPLRATACHCTSCRHATGALYTSDINWPLPASQTPNITALSSYALFPTINILFCATCSSPLFFHKPASDWLGAFTGQLRNDPDLVRLEDNIFVTDTRDGGASAWLGKCNADGTVARRWKGHIGGEMVPNDWPGVAALKGSYERNDVRELSARCHCGGVAFTMAQGEYEGTAREALPFFVDPVSKKNLGGFDACDTCRQSSGVEVFNWTFSELSYLRCADGNPVAKDVFSLKDAVDGKDARLGTLAYFASSKGVQRYFCSRCSACVFYAVEDRPVLVDVAIGLLDAPDGARGDNFLAWAFGKIGQIQDGQGGWREGFLKKSEEECDAWREEIGYPKNWRRVEREAAEKRGEKYY